MPDIFSKAKRSDVMSRIRSRGNKDTELALVKLFRERKITGWRRHFEIWKAESGKRKFRVRPDFVFRQVRLAVFVDGCFWHGCPQHATQPKNNGAFWKRKFAANKNRDRLVNRALRRAGWRVIRIWECALSRRRADRTLKRIVRLLEGV
ncbi:MAG TPA: very short patch repair endonuclease [Candidatus Paceibacterota bacterium]|nr:very short patch repair endonuclease [Candidatus Paceibacterota bacterium]